MLLFKKKFLAAIRGGEKTQTIRLWQYRRFKPGQRSYIPGAGYIDVERVEPIELEQLTDADALLDGFASAAELRQELATLYPRELAAGYQPYRVVFRLLSPAEQQVCRDQRRAKLAAPLAERAVPEKAPRKRGG